MFTGIVEEVGAIRNIKRGQHSAVLTIHAKTVLEETRIGDSIAVNGICLTVTRLFPDGFSADVMHETLIPSFTHKIFICSDTAMLFPPSCLDISINEIVSICNNNISVLNENI